MLKGKTVLLGVTGSIAAYKTCELISRLKKKNYNIDMDKILISKNSIHIEKAPVIDKGTGNNSLVLIDAGSNKATVMATLRQITGLGYADAKKVIEFIPTTFMTSISDKEADLTKKALEFVGAKVEIK